MVLVNDQKSNSCFVQNTFFMLYMIDLEISKGSIYLLIVSNLMDMFGSIRHGQTIEKKEAFRTCCLTKEGVGV